MEKGICPRENIQMVPEQQVECSVDSILLMIPFILLSFPNIPVKDGMVIMELCGFSWGGVNKCLFISDRALTAHHRNNSSQI